MRDTSAKHNESLITGWLMTHYGYSSIDSWIENVVGQLLKSAKQVAPPIIPERLFKLRKIVEYPRLYSHNNWETRFTMAHEIAHTFFFDLSESPPRDALPQMEKRIHEGICNRIAAEILMPKQMVGDFLKEFRSLTEQRFDVQIFEKILRTLVEQFNVSPAVASRRVVEDLGLWNILVLGVRWRSKSSERKASVLGKLEPGQSGFAIRLYPSSESTQNENQNFSWRLEWYAKPLWALDELFIPSVGNTSINLSIIETLYQTSEYRNSLENKEPLANFRIGNLEKYLRKTYGTRESYPVSAFFFRKPPEDNPFLPLEMTNQNQHSPRKCRAKVIICIPLVPACEECENK